MSLVYPRRAQKMHLKPFFFFQMLKSSEDQSEAVIEVRDYHVCFICWKMLTPWSVGRHLRRSSGGWSKLIYMRFSKFPYSWRFKAGSDWRAGLSVPNFKSTLTKSIAKRGSNKMCVFKAFKVLLEETRISEVYYFSSIISTKQQSVPKLPPK